MSTPKTQGTSGWIIFASTLLVLGSVSQFATGLTMIFNSEWVQFNTGDAIVDIKIHGWISLTIGILMVAAAWGVIGARTWARVIGVVFGGITVLNGMLMIPTYAVLGLVIAAFGVMVIYALTIRGHDVSTVPQSSLVQGVQAAETFQLMDEQADEEQERGGS
jgi:hypothetical protein